MQRSVKAHEELYENFLCVFFAQISCYLISQTAIYYLNGTGEEHRLDFSKGLHLEQIQRNMMVSADLYKCKYRRIKNHLVVTLYYSIYNVNFLVFEHF